MAPPAMFWSGRLVEPRKLKRVCQLAPEPIWGTVLATMRGGWLSNCVRSRTNAGGTSSPPVPLATAEIQNLPGLLQRVAFGFSRACSVNAWPSLARTSTTSALPVGPASETVGSRLFAVMSACAPPARIDAGADAGRLRRSRPVAAGTAKVSLPNGPIGPPAQPSARAGEGPLRIKKGWVASLSVHGSAGPP